MVVVSKIVMHGVAQLVQSRTSCMATMLSDRCDPFIIFSALKSLGVLLGRSGLLLPTE